MRDHSNHSAKYLPFKGLCRNAVEDERRLGGGGLHAARGEDLDRLVVRRPHVLH